MKPTELRIGNLVQTNFKKEIEITDIKLIDFKENFFRLYDPIQLTEEWLLKFGFEHDSEVWFNNIALYKCHDGFNYNVNFYEYDNLHIIQYVHQLQNLYFALTGEELVLKK